MAKEIRNIGGKDIWVVPVDSKEWGGVKKGYSGELVEMLRADISAAPYNPRRIKEKNAANLSNSLKRFGMVEAVVVNTIGQKIQDRSIHIGGCSCDTRR